ncbi:MAG TPA: VacJ family lipoprotein [Burkholderiales bacterium]
MHLPRGVFPLFRLVLPIVLVLAAGCATTRGPATGDDADSYYEDANDPLEPFNRAMYAFNDKFDRYVLRPVARGYRAVVPRPIRRGVTNFFSNLREPLIGVNNALQGKFGNAAVSLGRFVTNSTIGLLGLFDVARHFGLERHDEDFGQTLAVWGIGEGPYLVLPFFGPSNFRDGVGLYADFEMYPPAHLNDESTRWTVYSVEAINTRAGLLEAGDILEQAAGQDPYVFVREAYRQRRRALINDGAAPEPAPLDPDIFEDEESGPGRPEVDDGPPAPGPAE